MRWKIWPLRHLMGFGLPFLAPNKNGVSWKYDTVYLLTSTKTTLLLHKAKAPRTTKAGLLFNLQPDFFFLVTTLLCVEKVIAWTLKVGDLPPSFDVDDDAQTLDRKGSDVIEVCFMASGDGKSSSSCPHTVFKCRRFGLSNFQPWQGTCDAHEVYQVWPLKMSPVRNKVISFRDLSQKAFRQTDSMLLYQKVAQILLRFLTLHPPVLYLWVLTIVYCYMKNWTPAHLMLS